MFDQILLDENGNEQNRIKKEGQDQYYMQSTKSDYIWSSTVNGQTTSVGAIRVLSPESITGDPRENERSGTPDGASFSRTGVLNESFDSGKQQDMVQDAISNVNGYTDVIKQSDRGSLDFKSSFKAGELIDMNGIYMNNHEALNYMWGEAISAVSLSGKANISLDNALSGAEQFNVFDHIFGHSETWGNQPNHNEAIARGYLNNSLGTSNSVSRDQQVSKAIHNDSLLKLFWPF